MSSEEKSYFEKWTIPIAVVEVLKGLKIKVPERKEQYFTDMMLKDRLNYIITMVNEKKDHLPPVFHFSFIYFLNYLDWRCFVLSF